MLKLIRAHIAIVLRTLHFPLYHPLVFDSLRKRGFEISFSPPPAPLGLKLYPGGEVARKGMCSVFLNPDKKIIACESTSLNEAINASKEVLEMCKEDFNVGEQEFDYYETILKYIAKPMKPPLEIIRGREWGTLYDKVSEVLGMKLYPYVISFVPAESTPKDVEWLDVRFYPDPAILDVFTVEVVYRSKRIENVFSFIEQAEDNIQRIIRILEE